MFRWCGFCLGFAVWCLVTGDGRALVCQHAIFRSTGILPARSTRWPGLTPFASASPLLTLAQCIPYIHRRLFGSLPPDLSLQPQQQPEGVPSTSGGGSSSSAHVRLAEASMLEPHSHASSSGSSWMEGVAAQRPPLEGRFAPRLAVLRNYLGEVRTAGLWAGYKGVRAPGVVGWQRAAAGRALCCAAGSGAHWPWGGEGVAGICRLHQRDLHITLCPLYHIEPHTCLSLLPTATH